MLNIIVIVFSAMVLVASFGLAYSYGSYMAYDYQALLDLYVLFGSGVGMGASIITLFDAIVREYEWRNY